MHTDIISLNNDTHELKWFAIKVRSRHEFSVSETLARADINVFLPSINKIRQWKDRKKTVTFPLFPGYIFVGTNGLERDKLAILKTPGVVCFVGQSRGEAEIVPPDQIIMLMKLVENKEKIDPYPYLIHGSRVRIKYGPLAGVEGLLVERKGKHLLVLSIDILQQGVSVQVDAPNVEVI